MGFKKIRVFRTQRRWHANLEDSGDDSRTGSGLGPADSRPKTVYFGLVWFGFGFGRFGFKMMHFVLIFGLKNIAGLD